MKSTTVSRPAFSLVGIRIRVKAMSPEIPALWGRFVTRIDEIKHIAEPHVSYGVMDNFDPASGDLDYTAAVSVSATDALPKGMAALVVPAATYAVFDATIPTVGETFSRIYEEWLPKSGCIQGSGPSFERYPESFDPGDRASKFSIYIPVEEKS